jgi:TonB-linked SusC/RagA family outer membrane protein
MQKRVLLLIGLLVLGCLPVLAQQTGISGKIKDEAGMPLPGVNVVLKGTTNGTVSDANGSYTINVPAASLGSGVLVFSFIGYTAQEIAIENRTTIDISLTTSLQTLNEVIVVGYGTQAKKDLTGSVVAISEKDFNKGQVVTPEQLIMGKVPGVQITSNGGAPGAGSRIRIRGGSSLNASNDPLIVIDGVPLDNDKLAGSPNPLSLINPNDIETFNVLKDASATAIYGSRASNGVIIITTKKGSAGDRLKVSFSSLASLATVAKTADVLSGDEFREVVNQYGTEENKLKLGTANTNWQNRIYREAFNHDSNLSLSGSVKSLPYRLSIGYLDQQGILITSSLKRTSASLNLNPTFLDDHLKVNVNIKGLMTKSRFADEAAIGTAVTFDPTQYVRTENAYGGYYEWLQDDGNPIALAPKNPVSTLEQRDATSTVKRSIGNLQLDYKLHFLPELRANLNLGYDIAEGDGATILPPTMASVFVQGGSNLQYAQTKKNSVLDFYLNYVKDLPDLHSKIDATAGYSYQNFISEDPSYPTLNFEGDTLLSPNPIRLQNVLVSFFGRLNYNFKDRYMLTATVRRDGSSRFSPDNRWGTFPSLAFAWRIIEEPFMKDVHVLSDLKLRAGYGITGQQDIGSTSQGYYPYLARYIRSNNEASYQLGNQFYETLRAQGYDFDIKWEETKTINVGVDYELLEGKISGSVDYYVKKTKDLLAEIPVPAGSNLTNRLFTNVGEIENRGFEAAVNVKAVNTGKFSWDVGVNATVNKNEVTSLSKTEEDGTAGVPAGDDIGGGVGNKIQIHTVGHPAFSYYVYKQVYDEDGKPIEGLYADLNEDGVITAEDKYRYHNPAPTVFLGFNTQLTYNRFSLTMALRASFDNYVYNNSKANAYYSNVSQSGYLINIPSSVKETNFVGPDDQNRQYSDHFVENASFLRMDNINLSYDFGKLVKDKLNMRLTAGCQNVFVITKYDGLDPEIAGGLTNTFYPRPRVYSLGVTLDF